MKITTENKHNPLLEVFDTPHQTAPFGAIRNEHFMPAFKAAIAEAKAEISAIVRNPEKADFANTIEALDRNGRRLTIIEKLFFNLNSAETNDELQQIAQEVAPLLSAFSNDVTLNEELFQRVGMVYGDRNRLPLTPEQHTLLENTYQSFVRNGANLSEADKQRYREISTELSKTSLRFQQNILAETNAYELWVDQEEDLAGLPEFVIEAAEQAAASHHKKGWLFTLQYPSYIPFMKYADNRSLREKLYRAFSSKGNHDNANDNKELIRKLVNLKLEKARLLGYRTHADFKLTRRMAENRTTVDHFLQDLHEKSRPFALKDFEEVRQFACEKGLEGPLCRWDWAYYSEQLKHQRYGFNEEEVKPYFRLENVIEGVFSLAHDLYGLQLKENKAISVYHPDVKPYEVRNAEGGFTAVLYLDFFPREGKRSGAWMTDFHDQYCENGKNVRPHVSVVCNFTRPTTGKPSLLTFDEVTTFLHEFGHSLHGMLSQCQYASTSGTNVFWDFVELPSQLHENWAYEQEWLHRFAVHYQTGEQIPQALLSKIIAAKNFQAGYASERQLSFAMLDMAYHTLEEPFEQEIAGFEKQAMAPTDLFDAVEGSLMSTAFSHIFAGGYDAGYYSYKWAEVLDADAFSVFRENGIFDPETARSFRENILEKGGSEHPMVLYRRFRGQDPTTDALLRRSGLTEDKL